MNLPTTAFIIAFTLASQIASVAADDPAAWKPVKIQGEQKMPEFEDVAEWINSSPLTASDLRGKVVVIHFITYG